VWPIGSQQTNRRSEKGVSRDWTEFESRESQLAAFQTPVHHASVRAMSNILTPTLDGSSAVACIIKLYWKSLVNIVCIDAFLEEKANDRSLLKVHVRWQNTKRAQGSSENSMIFKLPHDFWSSLSRNGKSNPQQI
jgi:hypothetical protein